MKGFTTLPISIEWCKFLGSADKIIVAGNDIENNCSIKILQKENNPNLFADENFSIESSSFSISSEFQMFGESINKCDLCGIPRIGKTFVALSTINKNISKASISLAHVEASLDSTSLYVTKFSKIDSIIPYTSIVFHPKLELLVSTNEAGIVTIYDIHSQVLLNNFKVDSNCIEDSQFLPSGHLITLSNSSEGALIKLWDLRDIKTNSTSKITKPDEIIVITREKNTTDYTRIKSHPLQDKILCGSNDGFLSLCDMRSRAVTTCQPHSDKVTDIGFHPYNHDIYLTSSLDGTMKKTNFFDMTERIDPLNKNLEVSDNLITNKVLPASIKSIDCIESRTLSKKAAALAGSRTGGLWTIDL